MDRGFGLEKEAIYGDTSINPSYFHPSFWCQADSVDFKLNDEPITRSGGSRMNKRARAGVMKPTGSTQADADLQQLTWYFYGFLDNYKTTKESSASQTYIHEFWGGEGKELPSFRAVAVFDMLKKYLYGVTEDGMSLEVSDEGMTVSADWIYKTEKAGIIGVDGETFTRPDELLAEQIFIMFYDVSLKLNNQALDGVSTAFKWEGKNNHDVDATIGLGSRYPQKRASAGKRENSLEITTTLTTDTVRSILNAEYGEVNALEPTSCKLLQLPLELNISHCENSDLSCKIIFPRCTVRVEYSMSNADTIEATLSLDTLGTGSVTMKDNTEIVTDMYVQLVNYQNISGRNIIFTGDTFLYNTEAVTVTETANGTQVTNITDEGRVYSANKPYTGSNTHDWEAPYTIEGEIVASEGEVRLQLFDSNETYVSRTLEQLGIEDGGKFRITNDGETVSYFVNDETTATYTTNNPFTNPVEIRFYATVDSSFTYTSFIIYQDEIE